MIPLYGFLEGDTMGLLILAEPDDTAATLVEKVQASASPRVAPRAGLSVTWRGRRLDPDLTVAEAGMPALDRFSVGGTPGQGEAR